MIFWQGNNFRKRVLWLLFPVLVVQLVLCARYLPNQRDRWLDIRGHRVIQVRGHSPEKIKVYFDIACSLPSKPSPPSLAWISAA